MKKYLQTDITSVLNNILSLRVRHSGRSNLSYLGYRLLRRFTPRNDMKGNYYLFGEEILLSLQTNITSVLNLAKRINCLFKFRVDFMKPVSLEKDMNESVNRFFEINPSSIDFEKI